MWLQLVNVLYVLVAIAMIGLILMQRGSGAQAGSGFGGGASATVFGARGSANFLSKSTAILATVFFLMALGMAIYLHKTVGSGTQTEDLGIMGNMAPATSVPAASEVPASDVPQPDPVPVETAPEIPTETQVEAPAETPEPATE